MLLMHKSVTDHGHNPLEMFHAVWSHCKIRVVRHVFRTSISGDPGSWKRPREHPRNTWIWTVEDDVRPANIGLRTAWRRAQNRSDWTTYMS